MPPTMRYFGSEVGRRAIGRIRRGNGKGAIGDSGESRCRRRGHGSAAGGGGAGVSECPRRLGVVGRHARPPLLSVYDRSLPCPVCLPAAGSGEQLLAGSGTGIPHGPDSQRSSCGTRPRGPEAGHRHGGTAAAAGRVGSATRAGAAGTPRRMVPSLRVRVDDSRPDVEVSPYPQWPPRQDHRRHPGGLESLQPQVSE